MERACTLKEAAEILARGTNSVGVDGGVGVSPAHVELIARAYLEFEQRDAVGGLLPLPRPMPPWMFWVREDHHVLDAWIDFVEKRLAACYSEKTDVVRTSFSVRVVEGFLRQLYRRRFRGPFSPPGPSASMPEAPYSGGAA